MHKLIPGFDTEWPTFAVAVAMFSMTAPAFMKPEGKAHARFATAEEGAKLPTPKSLQSALEDASYSQLEDRLEASLLSVGFFGLG